MLPVLTELTSFFLPFCPVDLERLGLVLVYPFLKVFCELDHLFIANLVQYYGRCNRP